MSFSPSYPNEKDMILGVVETPTFRIILKGSGTLYTTTVADIRKILDRDNDLRTL